MSLMSVCKDVADTVGLPRPSAVAASTDSLSRSMFAFCNEILEDLTRLEWPSLTRDYSFNTVVDQEQYALPADWKYQVTDSLYSASQYYSLRGSMSAGDWMRSRNALPSQIGRYRFRMYGYPLKISITPAPKDVQTLVCEYVTSSRVASADGLTLKPLYVSDDDVALIPEELVRKGLRWKLKAQRGFEYNEDYNDYEMNKRILLAQQLGYGSIPVALRSGVDIPEVADGFVPEQGFGA